MRSAVEHGLSEYSVAAYIIDPDGTAVDMMKVQLAEHAKNLLPMLQRHIDKTHTATSAPTPTRWDSSRKVPKPANGDLLLRVTTAFSSAERGTARNWLELKPNELSAILPPSAARVGDAWTIPEELSKRLLVYLFPPVGDYAASDSSFRSASLKAKLTNSTADTLALEIEGGFEMLHGPAPGSTAKAKLVGTAVYDRKNRTFTDFQIASTDARFILRWGNPAKPKEDVRKFVFGVEQVHGQPH
jgi:hypothetical protein